MTVRRGFSLIEIVIAVGIIALIGTATSTLLQRVSVNAREAGNQSLALKIAQNKVETLRANGYDVLPATGPFVDGMMTSLPSGSGSVTVTDLDAKTKTVVVQVAWVGSTVNRSVALTTLITQNSSLK